LTANIFARSSGKEEGRVVPLQRLVSGEKKREKEGPRKKGIGKQYRV